MLLKVPRLFLVCTFALWSLDTALSQSLRSSSESRRDMESRVSVGVLHSDETLLTEDA